MSQKKGNRFFSKYAKSSAAMVSLAIHGILLLIALSFVAVSVINKEDQHFEAKSVKRPRMQLKKLQVPVDIKKKKTPKPKLRKRLIVQPKLNQKVPEIKMPEITGVKGGLSSSGDGLGGGGSIGFSMPEINIFGLKSKGEKVFLILNCGPSMMVDARGGIPAYTIIKNELLAILEKLPSTTLFNVAVYNKNSTYILFPQMQAATAENVAASHTWLGPLNQFKPGMGNREYGPSTLGAGGKVNTDKVAVAPLKNSGYWLRAAMLSMWQQADAIYLLTDSWGSLHHLVDTYEVNTKWSESDQKKWDDAVAEARRKFEEENRQRREKGMAPKVFGNNRNITLVRHYVGNVKQPPKTVGKKKHWYSPDEIQESMKVARKQAAADNNSRYTMALGDKDRFSFNVIHFASKDSNSPIVQYKKLTDDLRGDYLRLEGLEAIRFKAAAAPVSEMPIATESSAPENAAAQAIVLSEVQDTGSDSANSLVGKWGYGKRKIFYEFTEGGQCIQRNRKGEENWSAAFSIISETIINIERDGGKQFELLADGALKTHDGILINRL